MQQRRLKTELENIETDNFFLKPITVLLETPNATLPNETDIWRALKPARPQIDRVEISLSDDIENDAAWRNVIRCELLRQQWRWQGRPLDGEENQTFNGAAELLRKWTETGVVNEEELEKTSELQKFLIWEMKAFAEMSEAFDTLTFPIQFSHNAPKLLYSDNFDKDLLARFLRYGLRVFSRYEGLEGLFDALQPTKSTSAQPYRRNDENDQPHDYALSGIGWRRAFIEYRKTEKQTPKVQAIVPLTQSIELDDTEENKNPTVTPLMLVLEETFFSQCGVTEWIEGEVVQVQDWRKEKNGEYKKLHQTGHDPIITTTNALDSEYFPSTDVKLKLKLKGPFGYTFDTGARQPLFGSSSFVIDSIASDWKFSTWDFAQLRFRRLSGNESGAAQETDWTEPIWVQFLPASDFAEKENRVFETRIEGDKFIVEYKDKNTDEIKNPAIDLGTENQPMSKYFLLLTYQIQDFRRQSEHQVYAGYAVLNGGHFENKLSAISILENEKAELQTRIIEVQTTPYLDAKGNRKYESLPNENLWEEILQQSPDENSKFRITRIFDPIKTIRRK